MEGFASGRIRIDPADAMGPTTLVEGDPTEEEILLAAALTARYSDHGGRDSIPMTIVDEGGERTVDVAPIAPDDPRITQWRIG